MKLNKKALIRYYGLLMTGNGIFLLFRVTEVGVMNFFLFHKNKYDEVELLTAPLDGTILPGVVRDSVIQIAKKWGIKVVERSFSIHEMIEGVKENRVYEAFGTGTAAVICPIKEFNYKGEVINFLISSEFPIIQ